MAFALTGNLLTVFLRDFTIRAKGMRAHKMGRA